METPVCTRQLLSTVAKLNYRLNCKEAKHWQTSASTHCVTEKNARAWLWHRKRALSILVVGDTAIVQKAVILKDWRQAPTETTCVKPRKQTSEPSSDSKELCTSKSSTCEVQLDDLSWPIPTAAFFFSPFTLTYSLHKSSRLPNEPKSPYY